MKHIFIEKNKSEPVLVLLHGTGGNESDLVQIGEILNPNASLLGLRGRVTEGGANRFFRRFGEGNFDLVDVAVQTDYLIETLTNLSQEYNFDLANVVLVGYSNGANIGGHLLLTKETPLKRGIFFHSLLLEPKTYLKASAAPKVWLSYGTHDPLVTASNFASLETAYAERGAETTVFRADISHGLTQEELISARSWLAEEAK